MAQAPVNPESYDASDITVLEGLEAVRLRPGMYIGSTGPSGLQHLIWEIVDNAVDEAMAGFCDQVYITIHGDGSVTVIDNGRGIPVDKHETTGKTGVETVMTTLHAGGKFGGKSYQVSGGPLVSARPSLTCSYNHLPAHGTKAKPRCRLLL